MKQLLLTTILLVFLSGIMVAQPTITSISPSRNAVDVSTTSNIVITFSEEMDESHAEQPNSVQVKGSFRGLYSTTKSLDAFGTTLTINPDNDFLPGEVITVWVSQILNEAEDNGLQRKHLFSFTVATTGTGEGYFSTSNTFTGSLSSPTDDPFLGDLDGDGDLDVVVLDRTNDKFYILKKANGSDSYTSPGAGDVYAIGGGVKMQSISLKDMDNDGDLDIVVSVNPGGAGVPAAYIYKNNGVGSFSYSADLTPSNFTTSNTYDALVADWNIDGLDDILTVSDDVQGLWPFTQTSVDTYSEGSSALTSIAGRFALSADFNNDDYPDFAIIKQIGKDSSPTNDSLGIMLSDGSGGYTTQNYNFGTDSENNVNSPWGMDYGDINSDGYIDLVVSTTDSDNGTYVLSNDGDGTFTMSSFDIPNSRDNIKLGDLNGDGHLDIAYLSSYMSFAFNDGNGNFNQYYGFNRGFSGRKSQLADADGDGDLDVIYTVNGTLTVYSNVQLPTPSSSVSSSSFENNYGSQIDLSWSGGNGSNTLVLVKQGSAVDSDPVDDNSYSASTTFGNGDQIGSGNYVAYNGTGSSVTIDGLTTSTSYHVALYEFNQTGSLIRYLATNVATNSVTTNATDGILFDTTAGNALSFDGNSYSYMDTGNLPDSITVEMWVKPTVINTDHVFNIFEEDQFLTGINASNQFYASHENGGGTAVELTGSTVVSADQWYHVAVSAASSGKMKLYINGAVEDSSAITTASISGDSWYPGSNWDEDKGFTGEIDEIKIWETERTASEIRNYMYAPISGFGTDMIGYWQLNEGTGSNSDELVNNNDLSISSANWVTSSIPFGSSGPSTDLSFTSGTATVGNASISMADAFDNPVDIYVSELTTEPNIYPDGYRSSVGGKYFVIDVFGDPGTFSADLTLNYGSGIITSTEESDPSTLKLYKRNSNSADSSWTDLGGASSASASTGEVTWTGITSFSQFLAAGNADLTPETITFTKENYADHTLEVNQDRITSNVWLTRADTKGLFNIAQEEAFAQVEGSASPAGTQWAYGTTADIQALTFDTWTNTHDYDPPSMVGKDMVLFLVTDSVYLDITFDSWTSGEEDGGGGFSYTRSVVVEEINIQLNDSTNVINYTDSTYTFADTFFDLNSDFTDSELTISASPSLSGSLYLDQNSNGSFDEGTDSWLSEGGEASYTPSGSIKLRYSSSTAGVESTYIKLQDGESADSVYLSFYTIEGSPTLEGTADENGWYLLANPMDSTIGVMLDNIWTQGAVNSDAPEADATLYTFNQDSSKYVAITTDLDTTKLAAGTGLLAYIYAFDDYNEGVPEGGGWPKTLNNFGNPFETDLSIPVKNLDHDGVSGTSGSEGFVLLGNPYGWPLSADSVIATLKREDPLANSYVYRWKPVEKVYQLMTTGSIEPYESFFVRVVTSGQTGTLSFDYEDADIEIQGKRVVENPFELKLVHSESGIESNSVLRFEESGNTAIDSYDGYYLGTYANTYANLYTLIGDQPLTINNLPFGWDGELEFPIYLHATETGEFNIEWDKEKLPEGIFATLKHVDSGEQFNLNDKDSFTFNMGVVAKSMANKLGALPNQSLKKGKTEGEVKPVFMLTMSSTIGTANENDLGIPTEVELHQNYPNPFNPTSVIRFGVPEVSKVKLEVFDILGRNVMTLVNNETKNPGRYNVHFNARNLASGLYIYRLVVGNKVMTKKMTLIK